MPVNTSGWEVFVLGRKWCFREPSRFEAEHSDNAAKTATARPYMEGRHVFSNIKHSIIWRFIFSQDLDTRSVLPWNLDLTNLYLTNSSV